MKKASKIQQIKWLQDLEDALRAKLKKVKLAEGKVDDVVAPILATSR